MARPSRARPAATSHDVAARAGVSQPTVSLVLSSNPKARVASATRERVLRAAEELGYRPNVVARSLARRRSYALGVVVPDIANQFFACRIHIASTKTCEVAVTDVSADHDAFGFRLLQRPQNSGRITGMEAAGDIGAADNVQHRHVISHRPGTKTFTEIAVQIECQHQ